MMSVVYEVRLRNPAPQSLVPQKVRIVRGKGISKQNFQKVAAPARRGGTSIRFREVVYE